jgi:NTP pyrophosphatase (non-canonical NTP hydrolase)
MKIENVDKYQELAMRTANKEHGFKGNALNSALGLCGEAGEFADILKKIFFQDKPLTPELDTKIKEELSDVAWYLALACTSFGWSISEVLGLNIAKLQKRFPNGFNAQDALARVDVQEGDQ